MARPTQDSWDILKIRVDIYSKQVQASWKTIEHDLAQLNDLVKDRYLIDKYEDVNIGLTLWTYQWVLEATWSDPHSLEEARTEITRQLGNLDRTLASIETESKEEP
jgi:hypothetical protein